MPALRSRERRLLIVAALLGIGVAGFVYIVEPLIERHAATRELVVARRALFLRQERLVARAEAYGRELGTLRAEIAQRRGRLLTGEKAPVAASELQKLVKTTAQEVGIEVRSERILAPVERGGYAEVPVEVTLSGPIRGLTAFLHQLDEAPILVALTDLKVRAPATGASRDLSATIALSGFIPAPAAGGGAAPPAPSAPAPPPPAAAGAPARPAGSAPAPRPGG
jgi:Tfp pilus assembly protein PilO